jgi:undecaprenyl-phosphate galactose phosphotransferase
MLQAERLEVFVVPAISGLPVQGIQAQHFLSSDTLMLRLQGSLFDPRSQHLKRGLDILLSILALLACAPILAWAAWCVWREDGSPVIYTTRRIGSGGREFDFIKFRSMVKNADAVLEAWKLEKPLLYAEFQENFKLADDPRVLKCGKWLRRLSIDELPQLWNVLRGDMSMVGPRPFPQRELSRLPPDAIVLYKQVRPGITGLWQVSGRSDTTFDRRMELNNWYVRNWSLWLDWVVLLKTVRVVLSSRGAV